MAQNDLDIILQAKLDESKKSVNKIKSQIKTINKENIFELKVNPILRMTNDVKANIRRQIKQLSKEVGTQLKVDLKVSGVGSKGVSNVAETTKKNTQAVNVYKTAIDELIHRYNMQRITSKQFQAEMNKLASQSDFTTLSFSKQEKVMKMLTRARQSDAKIIGQRMAIVRKTNLEEKKIEQKKLATQLKAMRARQREESKYNQFWQNALYKREQQIKKNIQTLELYKQKMLDTGKLRGELSIFSSKSALSDEQKSRLLDIRNQINGLNAATPRFRQNLASIQNQFSLLRQEVSQSGTVMGRMFDNLVKFMRFYIIGGAFVRIIGGFRNIIKTISELDEELTQLRKVSGETLEVMERFSLEANEIGKNLGVSTKEVVKATTEFARLGYSIGEASKLAEESILLSTVGNVSIEEASKSLISTVKAFGIQVDKQGRNIRAITDMVNETGNNFAISQSDIANILRRSSASMKEAGNTIQETIAIGTGAQEIVQDSAAVGTALKTLSMRVRGISSDGEDLTDLLPTLEDQFQSVGLTLRKDENTFKSTYEILRDLRSVWDNISDLQRADLLEAVAGE